MGVADSERRAIVCENEAQLAKITGSASGCPTSATVILIDPATSATSSDASSSEAATEGDQTAAQALGAITLEELRERGRRVPGGARRAPRGRPPDDPFTFIYTSGTTGPPKGARSRTATTGRSSTCSPSPAGSPTTRSPTCTCRSRTPSRC